MQSLNTLPKREFHIFCVISGTLAMSAGYTNAISMVALKSTLSHMTGVITRIGWSLALSDFGQFEGDIASLFGFIAGAFVATALVGPEGRWQLNWKYAVGFCLSGTILMFATYLASWSLPAILAKALIASAMGLQNGMSSVWSAGAGRTTHLTGFLVDITIFLAFFATHCFRGDLWRLKFVMPIFFGFLVGAFLGGKAVSSIGNHALLVTALVHYTAAVIIILRRPIFHFFLHLGVKGVPVFEPDQTTAPAYRQFQKKGWMGNNQMSTKALRSNTRDQGIRQV